MIVMMCVISLDLCVTCWKCLLSHIMNLTPGLSLRLLTQDQIISLNSYRKNYNLGLELENEFTGLFPL